MLLDQVEHFDLDETAQGYQKIIIKRARLMKRSFSESKYDKISNAIITWLDSPFYVFAWNVMWEHLGKLTSKEWNAIDDHVDTMHGYGLSADDANYEMEVEDPAHCIAHKITVRHLMDFIDYLIDNSKALSKQVIELRKEYITH